ncbi:hypothetical protein [Telluribacter sp. SYSU D00476]|uniref:hypothetical protein n=1 Tax=Telluribacter sp. SYSU D00476 TaxID=2811430 RepID=UPI001FF6E730|nr:hypothetical protein [Telluribacter sp. SYSU D00476]
MKTIFKSLICALALSTSVAFAGPDKEAAKPTSFQTGAYTTIDGRLAVIIVKNSNIPTTVLIRNAGGDILSKEHVGKKHLKQCYKFDVSNLGDGEYTVEVIGNGEAEVRSFTISNQKQVTQRKLTIE